MKRVRIDQVYRHLKEEPIPPLNRGHKSNRLDSIGESFKTVFARMQNIKLNQYLDENGESLNDVEKILSSLNIKLRDSTGNFRNMSDVLNEVAGRWKTFNSLEQSAIANAIAGM